MNTLIMDTSSSNMLVALNASDELIIGKKYNTPKHLETLMPAVDELLTKKNFNVANLDYIGVVVGPGSFTGIRIAVSTAKAMMMVNKKIKAIAVNAMELLYNSYYKKTQDASKVAAIIPTTIKKVYLAIFENGKRLEDDSVVELEHLGEYVKDAKIITPASTLGGEMVSVDEKDLNDYVLDKIRKGEFSEKLSPCYIGLSQAEEQLKSKENK